MYTPYIRITTGNVQTVLDNVAKNPVGCIYSPPAPQGAPLSHQGPWRAAGLQVRLLQLDQQSGSRGRAPAPVYYTDETFTTVTGNAAEAYSAGTGITGTAIAGYWMPNTTAIPTLSNVTSASTQQVNQSYGFIQTAGFLGWSLGADGRHSRNRQLHHRVLPAGSWASTAAITIVAGRQLGIQFSAIASSLCDVLVAGYTPFWGS
jgi:hypothetical protein